MKTALLLDDDLGFMFWLAELLCTAGYHPHPALSVDHASSLLCDSRCGVDLAIVNLDLPDAVSLVMSLGKATPPPQILTLEPQSDEFKADLPGVTACLRRPDSDVGLSLWREEFLRHLVIAGEAD